MSKCEKCGKVVVLGDWPFCPHEKVGRRAGPYVEYFDEHISADGAVVTSNRHHERLMKENNLFMRDRTGKPGCQV